MVTSSLSYNKINLRSVVAQKQPTLNPNYVSKNTFF